jgi:2-phosphosulfolactate phosphatase
MPTLHVLLKKEEIDGERLQRRAQVVIVLDILFATSSIVHAFEAGVDSIWPALDHAEALRLAAPLSQPVLAGEYLARPLPGFAGATPLALARENLHGNALVYCTTNGTVALRKVADVAHVYAGALLNAAALAAHVVQQHPELPVLVVCSGSANRFNLEDFVGAGHFVAQLLALADYDCSDAARAALLFRGGCEPRAALLDARVGRMMLQHGLRDEVEYAAQTDIATAIPQLIDGRLRRAAI